MSHNNNVHLNKKEKNKTKVVVKHDVEDNNHGDTQFKPNTTVAAVVHHKGMFLLVEEVDKGKIVFNQPAGHLEKNEDLIDAIKREVLEETGLALSPDYLSGIYYLYRADINLYFLRFCFVIELKEPLVGTPQDDEIITTHWLTLHEIEQKSLQLRSTLVLECIEDYLSGNKIPLSSLKSML